MATVTANEKKKKNKSIHKIKATTAANNRNKKTTTRIFIRRVKKINIE